MTNKLIGVLKYHQDHKLIKSEVVGFGFNRSVGSSMYLGWELTCNS